MDELFTDIAEEVKDDCVDLMATDNKVLGVIGVGVAALVAAGIGAFVYFKKKKSKNKNDKHDKHDQDAKHDSDNAESCSDEETK